VHFEAAESWESSTRADHFYNYFHPESDDRSWWSREQYGNIDGPKTSQMVLAYPRLIAI
jgi:hypothetical protein